jgi:hypothetical protein
MPIVTAIIGVLFATSFALYLASWNEQRKG